MTYIYFENRFLVLKQLHHYVLSYSIEIHIIAKKILSRSCKLKFESYISPFPPPLLIYI